ncbi:MAG: SPASM domain-containing protein [Bacteroidetes bacterium]|nr:SPASM domain-containing protein [Bacteroidota bacterium]
MNNRRLFLFRSGEKWLAFSPYLTKIFELNNIAASVIKMVQSGASKCDIVSTVGVPETEVSKVTNWFESIPPLSDDLVTKPGEKILRKLVVLTDTHCNLNCKYCYGDGGAYGNIPLKMSHRIAARISDYFIKVSGFEDVIGIDFFGGEPLLNYSAIEIVCSDITKLHEQGILRRMPELGITTNGTVLNDGIINLLNKHNLAVCFSIDGPEEIHDKLRLTKKGRGSLRKILKNIDEIRRRCPKCELIYDATYTKLHADRGMKMQDVREAVRGMTGIEKGVVVPVMGLVHNNGGSRDWSLKGCNLTDIIINDVDNLWEKYLEGNIYVDQIVSQFIIQFIQKKMLRVCELGSSIFAVSPSGEIFPCQILVGKKEFVVGNVFDNGPLMENPLLQKFLNENQYLAKRQGRCAECSASYFCSGCPARWLLEFGSLNPPEDFCKKSEFWAQVCLTRLTHIKRDPDKWSSFTSALLKRKYQELC